MKMKRREALQLAAAGTGALLVGVPEAQAESQVEWTVSFHKTYSPETRPWQAVDTVISLAPGHARPYTVKRGQASWPHSKLVSRFEDAMLYGALYFAEGEPVLDKKMEFRFTQEDGSPWLPPPLSEDGPMTCDTKEVLVNQRWTIIDRARALRMHTFWRQQMHASPDGIYTYGETPMHLIEERGRQWMVWKDEVIDQLRAVHVRFYVS